VSDLITEHVDISARNANNDTQHGDTKTKFNFKMFAIVVSALLVALLSCFAFVAFRYWITKNKHITSKDNTENGSVKNNLMVFCFIKLTLEYTNIKGFPPKNVQFQISIPQLMHSMVKISSNALFIQAKIEFAKLNLVTVQRTALDKHSI